MRAFASYTLLITTMTFILWMSQIIPAIVSNRPSFLDGTTMLTSPVHVLDLSISLPISALAGVWLWQRKSWGYVLTGLMLTMLTIEAVSIAIDQVFGHLSDPTQSLAAVPVFTLLALVGLVVVLTYLRYLGQRSDQ